MKSRCLVEGLENRQLLASTFSAAVNFGPITARAPGMLADYGASYGIRRGGITYGWSSDLTASTVNTAATKVVRNNTFINIPSGSEWDISVPNGTYSVYVVAGDPTHSNQRMALGVEGQVAVAGFTRKAKPYLEGGVSAVVKDGKLTVYSMGSAGQDKINYIGITQTSTSTDTGGSTSGGSTSNGPAITGVSFTSGPKETVARTEPESAVVNNQLYVFSGYGDKAGTGGDGWQPSPSYERYDPTTNKWTVLGKMPVATTHAAITVVGTDVWFGGGYTARAGTTDKQDIGTTNVWIYHTKTNTWSKGPALPQKRASSGMAYVNGKICYVSGEPIDHHSDVQDVWALDVGNQSAGWKTVASIPEGRTHFGIAAVGNNIYVIGGQLNIDANATFLKTAYKYDTVANKWTRIADLPSIRSHLSPNTFVVNGKILSFGGEWKFNYELSDVLEYDPTTNKFTTIGHLPAQRAAGAAGYVNGKVVFTGGKNNAFFSDTWIGTLKT